MSRRRTDQRQVAMPFDMRERPRPEPPRMDLRVRELGSFVGLYQGKNLFIDICDRCHEPGVKMGIQWFHTVPCDSPCTQMNAPRPAIGAQRRLLLWYQWCQQRAREHSTLEEERKKKLEELLHPMASYLVDQLARPDRRHLPSVTECRMIKVAMTRTADDSWIDPLELEEWTARNTS